MYRERNFRIVIILENWSDDHFTSSNVHWEKSFWKSDDFTGLLQEIFSWESRNIWCIRRRNEISPSISQSISSYNSHIQIPIGIVQPFNCPSLIIQTFVL